METEIIWAELHSPIFLGGTNLQAKLDPTKRTGLKLMYNEDKKQLYVSYNNCVARIPEPSILSMVEGSPKVVEIKRGPGRPPGAIKAQVSTPMDHVFAGHGAGKTNDHK